jgi:uncharacterized membrane protein YbjE (DUF340 family)
MRYVVAMVFAVIGAGLAAVLVSGDVANWVVAHQTFESPDDVSAMEMATYMASNVAGLIVGWLIGWTIAGIGRAGRQAS